jgi:hypothetical protein
MSVSSDLGISPVLLQAISSLTSVEGRGERASTAKQEPPSPARSLNPTQIAMDRRGGDQGGSKGVTHLLHGMNEPVTGLLPVASPPDSSDAERAKQEEAMLSAAIQERLASQLMSQSKAMVTASTAGGAPTVSSDMSMVSVLTALASQHMRANIKQESVTVTDSTPHPVALVQSTPSLATTSSASADVIVRQVSEGADERGQPQIIIYYNNESAAVPSPNNDVVVGELEGDGMQGAVQNYRIVMHQGADGSQVTLSQQPSVHMVSEAAAAAVAAVSGAGMSGTYVTASNDGQGSSATDPNLDGICPICTDRLSGRVGFLIMMSNLLLLWQVLYNKVKSILSGHPWDQKSMDV